MTDRDALLAAIAADPAADLPRLVFADWLDEHGDAADRARAEYVRLDIRGRAADDPDRDAAKLRAAEILAAHRESWCGPESPPRSRGNRGGWSPDGDGRRLHFPFARGFVTGVVAREPFDGWLDTIAGVIPGNPVGEFTLDSLTADAARELVGAMHSWPALGTVRTLRLHADVEPGVAAALGRNPHLRNVRELDLGESSTPATLAALAAEPLVARVKRVRVALRGWRMPAGAERGAAVADLLNRSAVEHLHLGGCDDASAGDLFRTLRAPGIAALDLSERGFRDPFLPAFARSAVLPNLRSLNLRMNFFGAAELAKLFRDGDLRNLTRLRVSDAISYAKERSADVWHAIRHAPFAANLVELDFGGRPGLTAAEVAPLARDFPRLEVLSLGPAQLGDAGVGHVAGAACAARLRELVLWDCGVTDRGARTLADEAFPAIERLSVRGNAALTDAGKQRLRARYGDRAVVDWVRKRPAVGATSSP